tara:strand:- start:180 stop:785 length:606 start_codon:yes stop_codon:yes gene_type:complete
MPYVGQTITDVFPTSVSLDTVTATTSLKTPLVEFTDGDNAFTISDGGNVAFSGTVSGAGDNTPSFYGILASDQTLNNAAWTKLLIATEGWDTDSAFSSNKFTVPTGKGGKYVIGFSIATNATMDSGERHIGKLYINGSATTISVANDWSSNTNQDLFINHTTLLNLSEDDYVELYAYQNDGGTANILALFTSFWAFKLGAV